MAGIPRRAGPALTGGWSPERFEANLERGLQQFWLRVSKTDGCWVWTGAVASNGYGTVSFMGRNWLVHRLAYWLTNGAFDPSLEILHSCDNKLCVRPEHLSEGSRSQNMREAWDRGLRKPIATCHKGHPTSLYGTVISGRKRCKQCQREAHRRWRERAA